MAHKMPGMDGGQAASSSGISRRGVLGLSLGLGLAGVGLSACGSASGGKATTSSPIAESSDAAGDLVVLEWSGFEVPELWKPYAAEFPGEKLKFPVMTNTQDAYTKLLSGAKADLTHPSFADLKQWTKAELLRPFDRELIKNFAQLNPALTARGVVDDQQYAIPSDWGYNSITYRSDLVDVDEPSWGLLFDDRYAGKISWRDHPTTMPVAAALHLGIAKPYDMTDAELGEVKALLLSKKHLVKNFWSTETDLRADMAAGNVLIAPSEGGTYVAMQARGLDVTFMNPKEGRITWLEGFAIPKISERPYRAHRYVDAWVSTQSGEWLEANYSYGSPNTKVDLSKLDPKFVDTFNLNKPDALADGVPEGDCPRKNLYVALMNDVKAA